MNDLAFEKGFVALDPLKFRDPDITAKGEARATVALERLDTLWINTGTLCNITCVNCYIESSPTNDRLAYITAAEARAYLYEIAELGLPTAEIGFTGGEPFMNPDMLEMLEDALSRGFRALVLTNAMQPMQRPPVRAGLLRLRETYGDRLVMRVSLDHYTAELHEQERGAKTFDKTLAGLDWLAENGFSVAIAGRSVWGEPEPVARAGYAALFAERGWPIDADDRTALVIFPEMDARVDVPEITTACWGILDLSPNAMMCATSRMVVKRRGAAALTVLPCTLLPYDDAFGMGATLAESLAADGGMFSRGAVKLCHPHCAKFCVLGGGSCAPE
ncbi:radical SAM protein [Microbaculum marinisediminis]|uniref:Radical SAM protein n=1 Tax=Microbaculum marinisediminis TaxID=2931392 RepID=A0AAW5QVJ8_9HYPH|nr:radical SAM protein [Microbaculum sp. A6E488]MCT8970688.1 radical SAM protein [Microbaculum sp. A6E488]